MTVKHKVHKYKKALLGKKVIYRCIIPDCSHYLHRDLVTNHLCLCWRCNQPFVLPKAPSLLKSKPVCEQCEDLRKTKKVEAELPSIPDDVMARILGSF